MGSSIDEKAGDAKGPTTGRFSIAPGVLDLIGAAIGKRSDSGFSFTLSGDLAGMGAQKEFLLSQGFEVGQLDCYPALRTEGDFTRAIKAIFEKRIEGWWNYERDLVDRGVCTRDEYLTALSKET
jgi:hypothetical protein